MKSIYQLAQLVILFSLGPISWLQAQRNELSLQAGSGLFSFRGGAVTSQSFFNIGTDFQGRDISYTNESFSPKSGFSYSFGVQGQRITKSGFIYGVQISYESLATQTQITQGYASGIAIPFVDGHSTSHYQYTTIHPLLGYRLGRHDWQLDLSVGVDLAYGLSTIEKGQAFTTTHLEYTTDRASSKPPSGRRPRVDLTGYYRRMGVSVGFARGTTNYTAGFIGIGTDYTAYDQLWRVSLFYRLLR